MVTYTIAINNRGSREVLREPISEKARRGLDVIMASGLTREEVLSFFARTIQQDERDDFLRRAYGRTDV